MVALTTTLIRLIFPEATSASIFSSFESPASIRSEKLAFKSANWLAVILTTVPSVRPTTTSPLCSSQTTAFTTAPFLIASVALPSIPPVSTFSAISPAASPEVFNISIASFIFPSSSLRSSEEEIRSLRLTSTSLEPSLREKSVIFPFLSAKTVNSTPLTFCTNLIRLSDGLSERISLASVEALASISRTVELLPIFLSPSSLDSRASMLSPSSTIAVLLKPSLSTESSSMALPVPFTLSVEPLSESIFTEISDSFESSFCKLPTKSKIPKFSERALSILPINSPASSEFRLRFPRLVNDSDSPSFDT